MIDIIIDILLLGSCNYAYGIVTVLNNNNEDDTNTSTVFICEIENPKCEIPIIFLQSLVKPYSKKNDWILSGTGISNIRFILYISIAVLNFEYLGYINITVYIDMELKAITKIII